MKRLLFALLGLTWVGAAAASLSAAAGAQTATPAAAPRDAQYGALVKQYCVTCHNDRLRIAELSLEKLDVANVAAES